MFGSVPSQNRWGTSAELVGIKHIRSRFVNNPRLMTERSIRFKKWSAASTCSESVRHPNCTEFSASAMFKPEADFAETFVTIRAEEN
eukprot:3555867-Rhodomonas_salina.6